MLTCLSYVPADSEGELFSWQQDGAVVPSDDEIEKEVGPDLWVGPGLACSPERARASSTCDDDVYRCDSCKTHIQGFRYTCVQCVDVELCCACEARQAHAQHYVLRIPGPRPRVSNTETYI
ncbi:hypothetical protein O0L34_g16758 [Tuta absoluta]|nr:hypothetical protein O0L34_g16758 [Tuta absoluta]